MMLDIILNHPTLHSMAVFMLGCYKTPPLKESRPEIPREKGKGRDTSDEDPLRSPMLPLYQNDETIAL